MTGAITLAVCIYAAAVFFIVADDRTMHKAYKNDDE